jgi:hypothetical protein
MFVTKEQVMNIALNDIIAQIEQNNQSGKRVKNRTYVTNLQGDTKAKFAPQARMVLIAILKHADVTGNAEITEQAMMELVENLPLDTKQEKWKIFQFYRKSLIDAGFLKIKE